MQRQKRKKILHTYAVIAGVVVIGLLVLIGFLVHNGKEKKDPKFIEPTQQAASMTQEPEETQTQEEQRFDFKAEETDATTGFPKSVVSKQGILIDVENGTILAKRKAFKRMVPASMTKIFTVLVAAKNITPEQLDDTVKISIDATDFSYSNDCSNTGYEVDEQVTVRDLFYGTILPSGADSAVSLADYVAGSQDAFVELMNQELEKMGLSETTHFTNCVGIYSDDHYSTPYDMAMILKAAMDNELCREVLGTRTYTTSETKQHKEGITVSNWFLRRIEDKDTHSEIIGAKTGFVNQSGSCAASMAKTADGKEYICVTAGSTSSWRCIYDHVDTYSSFLPEQPSASGETIEAVTQ